MSTFFIYVALGVAAVVGGFAVARRFKGGRYAIDSAILRLPVFSKLVKEFNLTRFFRSLQSLHASNVPLLESVNIARKFSRTFSNVSINICRVCTLMRLMTSSSCALAETRSSCCLLRNW